MIKNKINYYSKSRSSSCSSDQSFNIPNEDGNSVEEVEYVNDNDDHIDIPSAKSTLQAVKVNSNRTSNGQNFQADLVNENVNFKSFESLNMGGMSKGTDRAKL